MIGSTSIKKSWLIIAAVFLCLSDYAWSDVAIEPEGFRKSSDAFLSITETEKAELDLNLELSRALKKLSATVTQLWITSVGRPPPKAKTSPFYIKDKLDEWAYALDASIEMNFNEIEARGCRKGVISEFRKSLTYDKVIEVYTFHLQKTQQIEKTKRAVDQAYSELTQLVQD
ncbi:MAG: hypothetical protein ACOYOK_06910 [Pseudobdellovibrionaceae bacterium]